MEEEVVEEVHVELQAKEEVVGVQIHTKEAVRVGMVLQGNNMELEEGEDHELEVEVVQVDCCMKEAEEVKVEMVFVGHFVEVVEVVEQE